MRVRSMRLMVAIAAIALLGICVSAASAGRLEISSSIRGFKIIWTPIRLQAAGREAACPVTLEGTFERASFPKSFTVRVLRFFGATVGTCTRNTMTLLRETLPWEGNYSSFSGTLPLIRSVSLNIIRMSFRANLEGIECLAATRAEQPAGGIATIEAGGTITGFRADETRGIETIGGFFCSIGGRASFAGDAGTITERGGASPITIRLI